MGCITLKNRIAAPVERVWATVMDVPSWPERIEGIKAVEILTEGPVRVGTRIRETRVMFGREASEVMEFTAIEPERRYELCCENHGCRYRSEFAFAPAAGGTDVSVTFEAIPMTVMAKIMSVVMRPMIAMCRKEIARDLEDLKRAVESSPQADDVHES